MNAAYLIFGSQHRFERLEQAAVHHDHDTNSPLTPCLTRAQILSI